ncbi:PaaI family thioesterase [Halalkalibacter oceani]|uniref:PaaI family thioesterase n=1 Tax=Halalkalibacter oceani TaxID=1653776 RepID=A0A9X2IQK3_9BACI|nr:PaaI family thioesterase [Halalkalibacter oceani]MCM3716405.1 PaaI family thioesterase [Halalkalibacter oceani]
MLDKLMNDLEGLSAEQVKEIERVVQLYKLPFEAKDDKRARLHYFARFLGIDWGDDGELVMELGQFNENTYGVAQGGALYTLADISIGMNIVNELKKDQEVYTLEMKMNFIKKGVGSKVYAKTKFLHRGQTTVVAECQITDDNESLVAHSLGTFYIVNKKK